MIPQDKEKRLIVLRQQLAMNPELSELIKMIGEDFKAVVYERAHGTVGDVALTHHILGQAKGVTAFVEYITASPTAGNRAR